MCFIGKFSSNTPEFGERKQAGNMQTRIYFRNLNVLFGEIIVNLVINFKHFLKFVNANYFP
jgi:hypothetical protein